MINSRPLLAILAGSVTALALMGCQPKPHEADVPVATIPATEFFQDCQDAQTGQPCLSLDAEGTRHHADTYRFFWEGKGTVRQSATPIKACNAQDEPIPCVTVYRDKKSGQITKYEIIGYNQLKVFPN